MNILLMGGAGYIGPVIADRLLSEGNKVTIADHLVYNNGHSIINLYKYNNFKFINISCGEITKDFLIRRKFNVIVILSGLVGDPITKSYPELSQINNEQEIQLLAEKIHDNYGSKIVFISTCSNYGLQPEGVLADETTELKPLSLYAKSKVKNESYLINKFERTNNVVTILRFATAYGIAPRMRFDLTINQFCLEMQSGQELEIFDADTWRPYCHVQDFAAIVSGVLRQDPAKIKGQIFNAGSNENNYTKRHIVDKILHYLPDAKVKYKEIGSDARDYRVKFDKLKRLLNFKPEYNVDRGISGILEAARNGVFDLNTINQNRYGNYIL